MNHRAPHPATVRSPVIAMLLALASITACAQAPTPPEAPANRGMAVSVPDVFVSSDSEGLITRKVGIGLYPGYAHGERYTGLQVQRTHYSQSDWRAQSEALSLVHRAVNPRNALGYQVKVGIDQLDSRQLLTLDSSYHLALNDTTTAEFLVHRERVETPSALGEGLSMTSGGAGLWHQVNDRLNAGGILQMMRFSDGNTRTQLRLRGVYDLLPEHGLTAQLRYRGYRASDTQVPRRYFNPGEFEEMMAAVGLRRQIAGWVVRGTLGLGRQRVDTDASTPTELAELSVTSPIAGPVFWRARAGYSRASGLQGPDYRYRYLMNELFAAF